jgi:Phage P22-like portal protein
MDYEDKKDGLEGDEKLLQHARERFKVASEAEESIRRESLEDLRFRAGEQWPENIKIERQNSGRPCLTINRIPQFLRQVTNEIRQNRPSIQVNPVDDMADPETAEILQGIMRHIEVTSDADVAYDTAAEHAATFGFGYIRVITDYVDERSFDQEIKIERIRNPFSIYFDPECQKTDYSDARYAFVVQDIERDEFKKLYPESELSGMPDLHSVGDQAPGWITGKSVRIAEYWHIDYAEQELAMLEDGSVMPADQVPEGMQVLRTRTVQVPTVYWCKINGLEVLEKREWPGKWIPIIPVLGDEVIVNGDRQLFGVVRFARDPQRMYNYWATAETEMIALAPKAPFIGAAGQFEGFERQWQSANTRNFPYLEYKPISHAGVAIGAPQRQVYEPPIQAISHARMQANDDLKATTGIYDASLGARSNEQSGRAILARQREGDVANFHYADNLARSIKHLGRIVLDLIPQIYDAPRVMRIIGTEDQERVVQINTPTLDKGVERIYDLSVGQYDVTVSVGPSFSTKRQEAVDSMMQLSQAYPPLMQVAGDLLVKNMDWPGAAEIAERLKKLLPPNLQEGEENEQQVPPEVQAQMAQMAQQNEQLSQALNQATDDIRTKRMELESRERIEAMKAQTELVKIEAQLSSRENIELLRQEIASLKQTIAVVAAEEEQQQPAMPGQEQEQAYGG